MIPRNDDSSPQRDLYKHYLEDIINPRHSLVQLSRRIDWESVQNCFAEHYCADNGAPGRSIRLQVGLQLLKHLHGLSDAEVLAQWVENPYWQYLCGEVEFQHRPPMDETTMSRFRHRIGEEGGKALLKLSVELGKSTGTIRAESTEVVVIDTTVMPKAITYPTDGKLLGRCLLQLVVLAKREGVQFRQTYQSKVAGLQWQVGRYAHARQFKRMRRALKTLWNYLGRVWREVDRQLPYEKQSPELRSKYKQALQLLIQTGESGAKNRLYSLHAPEVVCIAKGKSRQPYEFGRKVSVATTADEGFVVDCQTLYGNPFDGHTIGNALFRLHLTLGCFPSHLLLDRGYKGSDQETLVKAGVCQVHITGRKTGSAKAHEKQHRRNSIEPVIGHMKQDGLMDRCHLKGHEGDAVHALLCGVGFNLRKILNHLRRLFWALKLSASKTDLSDQFRFCLQKLSIQQPLVIAVIPPDFSRDFK